MKYGKVLMGLLLFCRAHCELSAETSVSFADSTDQVTKILEQEHLLIRRIKEQPRLRLASVERGLNIEHTIIEAKLILQEHGEIDARAGICLEYLDTDLKNLSLSLGGGGIQVWSVLRSSGDSLAYLYSGEEGLLSITIPASTAIKDTLWITYSGEFTLSDDSDTISQSLSEQLQTPFQEMTADYAYALGGLWFPSKPDDNNLQSLDINLTIPEGFVAVATGDSTDITQNEDGTITYSYSSRPYGFVYNTGSFSVGHYKKHSKTIDNVKTTIFSLERESWQDNTGRIERIFENIRIILGYYRDLYGGSAYPWKELKIVETGRSYFPLGVADLEWTILPQDFFYYDPASLDLDLIHLLAHEIAHQWWGMKVSPDPDQSPWLAEGIAEFSAKSMVDWYIESNGIAEPSPWTERKKLLAYTLLFATLPIADSNADYMTVYEKGTWVVRMLQQLIGEQNFKKIINLFLEQYNRQIVSLEEFSGYWQSQASGTDLSWFFDQWFYKADVPHYIVRGHKIPEPDNSWQVSVTQQTDWDIPVEIALYYPGGNVEKSTQQIAQIRNDFVFSYEYGLPDSVRLDPDNILLSYNQYPSNISLRVKPNTINVDEPAWLAVTLDSLFPQQSARLNWRVKSSEFQTLEFDFSNNLTDTVFIPPANSTARIDYYLEMTDTYGQSLSYPEGAPDSLYSYYFTEYWDLPENLAWASFYGSDITGETSEDGHPGLIQELSIFNLDSGIILHTYSNAGGFINISPNNKYLVSDDYTNDELVVINQDTGWITSRIPYSSDLQPQMLAITNDGKDVFMSATLNTPGSGLEGTYHIAVEYRTFFKLDKAYAIYEYNPLDNKMYMRTDKGFDVYDITNDGFCDSIIVKAPINFHHRVSFAGNYRVLSEIVWGGYKASGRYNTSIILNRRNILNGQVFETLTLPLSELGDELRAKTISAILLPNSTKVALIFKEDDHCELNFWDLMDATWHRNVVLEGSLDDMYWWEMKTDDTGKKLLISNVMSTYTNPCLAVANLDNYNIEIYMYPPNGRYYSARFEIEHPLYDSSLIRGDANLDGRIDIFDLLFLLGNISGKSQNIFFESDVNEDGKIDIFDLLGLLKLLK